MKWLPSGGAIVLAALLLVAGHLLLGPSSVAASAGMPARTDATPFDLPPDVELLFERHAKGVQTYACTNGQWAFRAPQAALFDLQSRQLVGIHYGGIDRGLPAGPWWESLADASRIRAGNPLSAPSPNPHSIPLLRLEVVEWSGSGVFTPVSHVLRLNTLGGVGPTAAASQARSAKCPTRPTTRSTDSLRSPRNPPSDSSGATLC